MKRRGGIITHVETYEHTRARARRIAVRSCCDARGVQKAKASRAVETRAQCFIYTVPLDTCPFLAGGSKKEKNPLLSLASSMNKSSGTRAAL